MVAIVGSFLPPVGEAFQLKPSQKKSILFLQSRVCEVLGESLLRMVSPFLIGSQSFSAKLSSARGLGFELDIHIVYLD